MTFAGCRNDGNHQQYRHYCGESRPLRTTCDQNMEKTPKGWRGLATLGRIARGRVSTTTLIMTCQGYLFLWLLYARRSTVVALLNTSPEASTINLLLSDVFVDNVRTLSLSEWSQYSLCISVLLQNIPITSMISGPKTPQQEAGVIGLGLQRRGLCTPLRLTRI